MPMILKRLFGARAFALALASATLLAQAADKGAPPTAVKPVTDSYGELKVTDPYRWLEKTGDPQVKQWSAAQDRRTRGYLDSCRPAGRCSTG